MKNIILVISLIMLTVTVQAQRRLPGQQGLQATIGKVDGLSGKSIHAGASLSKFTKNKHRWSYGVEFLCKKSQYNAQYIPVEQFTGEAGYYRTFLSDGGKTFFLSLGISGMAGYEAVNKDKSLLNDGSAVMSKSGFLIGGALSFEMEAYIIDHIILVAGFRQRFLPTSNVNRFHNQLGIGIKFIIN